MPYDAQPERPSGDFELKRAFARLNAEIAKSAPVRMPSDPPRWPVAEEAADFADRDAS